MPKQLSVLPNVLFAQLSLLPKQGSTLPTTDARVLLEELGIRTMDAKASVLSIRPLDAGFQLQQSHLQRTGFPRTGINDPAISNQFFIAEAILLPSILHCSVFFTAQFSVLPKQCSSLPNFIYCRSNGFYCPIFVCNLLLFRVLRSLL